MPVRKSDNKNKPAASLEKISGETATKKKYKNNWYLSNLQNVSKTIFEIGKQVRLEGFETQAKNRYANRAGLVKLFYFLYLTGSRVGEGIRPPMPKATIDDYQGRTIIKILKQNEKHFMTADKTVREIMTQQIILEDEWDTQMFNYIFDDGATPNLSFLQSFQCSTGLSQEDYDRHRKQISNLIESNFKTDLTDGTYDNEGKLKIYKKAGIVPHILRHLRTYNLLINKGHDEKYVQSYFGWNTADMIDTYLYIKNKLREMDQLQLLDKHFNYLDQTRRPKFKIGRENEIIS